MSKTITQKDFQLLCWRVQKIKYKLLRRFRQVEKFCIKIKPLLKVVGFLFTVAWWLFYFFMELLVGFITGLLDGIVLGSLFNFFGRRR